ncbi:MAG: polymerase sigma factor CnrH [Verrucomicrobiota bacterium]
MNPTPRTSADSDEHFVRLFSQSEPSLRAFVRSLLPSWEQVDEVMQETSLVLWRKFSQYDPETPFLRWACVVARFEALKMRRRHARDRHVFDEDLLALLADEAEENTDSLERQRHALDRCLEKLPDRQRRLVCAAYSDGVTMKEVAARTGCTPTSLYKAVNRVRGQLLECMQRSLQEAHP